MLLGYSRLKGRDRAGELEKRKKKEESWSRVGEYYIQAAMDRWRWGESQDERYAGVGRETGNVDGEKRNGRDPENG